MTHAKTHKPQHNHTNIHGTTTPIPTNQVDTHGPTNQSEPQIDPQTTLTHADTHEPIDPRNKRQERERERENRNREVRKERKEPL